MDWTETRPTEPGLYLRQLRVEWVVRFLRVRKGDWRRSENPESLYCGGEPVSETDAYWFGPIPESKNKHP